MAKYRKINPQIWNDKKFRWLSDNGKLVFFMLLTHPHTSAIGTLRAYIPGLAPELGWSEKAFREAFDEVAGKGMVIASEKDGLIWLPNFMKYNEPESPNVLKSWLASYIECPECDLKFVVYQAVMEFSEGLSEAFGKAFRESFGKTCPNQEQEQEQEQEEERLLSNESSRRQEACPPPCPHEEIIAMYHEALPELPPVRSWEGYRQELLRARWRETWARLRKKGMAHERDDLLVWWKSYFKLVGQCSFLLGKCQAKDRTPFRATLEWLVKPKNFQKVFEKTYVDRVPA